MEKEQIAHKRKETIIDQVSYIKSIIESMVDDIDEDIVDASFVYPLKDDKEISISCNIIDHPPTLEELDTYISPVPITQDKIKYIHISESGGAITYENGILKYRRTMSPGEVPLYESIPRSYFEEKKRALSEGEINKIFSELAAISLEPLYIAMKEDLEGTLLGICGAHYCILDIIYLDGQNFRFHKHRSVPAEFHKIYSVLSSYCSFNPIPYESF